MSKVKLTSNETLPASDVPEGTLPALVAAVDDGALNDAKNPSLNVQYTLTDGVFKGKSVYKTYRLRQRQDLAALKAVVQVASVPTDGDGGFETDDLVGRELSVVVRKKTKSWKDNTSGDVVIRNFADVVSVEPLSAKE